MVGYATLVILQHQGGRWHWVADSYPADAVSLRVRLTDARDHASR